MILANRRSKSMRTPRRGCARRQVSSHVKATINSGLPLTGERPMLSQRSTAGSTKF
jgi:hypothetical protein